MSLIVERISSVPVETTKILDQQKLELARQINSKTKFPQAIVRYAYREAISYLEERTNMTFEPSLQQKVWERVFPEQLKVIQETFLYKYCEDILAGFTDVEVSTMLEEFKKKGKIENIFYLSGLQIALWSKESALIDFVATKAKSPEWGVKILEAFQKEGIAFPNVEEETHFFNKK